MNATNNVTAVDPSGGGWVIWAYIAIIAVIAIVPHLVDIVKAYNTKRELRDKLLALPADKMNSEEFKALAKEASKPPSGISGLSRGTMAIGTIIIMGIALFHLLITRQEADKEVISNVLSMLGGLIAAIIGFYFGGKAAKEAGESAGEETKKVGQEARLREEAAAKREEEVAKREAELINRAR